MEFMTGNLVGIPKLQSQLLGYGMLTSLDYSQSMMRFLQPKSIRVHTERISF